MSRPTYTLSPESLKAYYKITCALCGSKQVKLEVVGGKSRTPQQQQSGQIVLSCSDCENPKARLIV